MIKRIVDFTVVFVGVLLIDILYHTVTHNEINYISHAIQVFTIVAVYEVVITIIGTEKPLSVLGVKLGNTKAMSWLILSTVLLLTTFLVAVCNQHTFLGFDVDYVRWLWLYVVSSIICVYYHLKDKQPI